jgi:hypothetical protein
MPVAPTDPKPNKALAAALTTVAGVAVQWATTGHLSLDQEGVTAITGAVATLLVYAVSNYRRLLG